MAIFKAFLSLIILAIPSTIGFIYGNSYKKRRQSLYDLQYSIRLLQSEILIKSTPLPKALKDLNKKMKTGIYSVFLEIGEELEAGIEDDIYLSFLSKENLLKSKFSLEDEDIEIFLYLGEILGQSNRYDQDKNLNFIIQQINELSIKAGLEEEKNQKLYPSLGVLIGIGMIIILL